MNIAKLITKGYFVAALTGSFVHIITSAHKLGGEGIEAWATPFMVDGVAILGMHMRNSKYDDRTNKIGFRVQCGAGVVSLAMNVYAARNLFGILFGIGIVGLFILAEWMSGQIRMRKDAEAEAQKVAEEARKAAEIAEMEAMLAQPTPRQIAARKAADTRKKNAARKAREAKVLERMVAGK